MSETEESTEYIPIWEREKSLPTTFLLVGRPRSGKSHMVKYLLQQFFTKIPHKCQFGIVFAAKATLCEYDYLPEKSLIEGYSEQFLMKYLDNLTEHKKKTGKPIPHNFIVFDDLVGLLESNTGAFVNFITTFRKTNTSVFIATQYLNRNISPTVRVCIFNAILFYAADKRSLTAMYDAFGMHGYDSFEAFKKVFFEKVNIKEHRALLFSFEENTHGSSFKSITAPPYLADKKISYSKRTDDDNNK